MTIRKKATILSNISTDLADNNAGEISASDVRANMYDAVESINAIVGSGNHDTSHPFVNNVRAQMVGGEKGLFLAESGITFINQGGGACTQLVCYPGPNGISHNDLADLTTGDKHVQYYNITGVRPMEGNVPMADYWIGSSGVADVGLKFAYAGTSSHVNRNNIHVGMSGDFVFQKDQSRFNSAQGIAKAWLNFDGSGVSDIPVVRSSYNIVDLKHHARGKYTISFSSGVLEDNNFVVVATSNSTTASGSMEDFDVNTVGVVMRYGSDNPPDAEGFRKVTFVIRNDAGEYVDGEINDLVVFAGGSGVTADQCNVTPI